MEQISESFALGRHTVDLNKETGVKTLGFTLAEVLITLSIIGVVASFTIPQLVKNMNDYAFSKSQEITFAKIKEATSEMKSNSDLDGYATNDAFADAFQKYMKINKRCAAAELSQCFPPEIMTPDGTPIDVTSFTTGIKLSAKNIGANTVGLMLANGTSVLLSLRDDAKLKAANAADTSCDRIDAFDIAN